MIDSDLASKLLNQQLSGVLESLEQDEISPDEAKELIQEEVDYFLKPVLEYKDNIDFESVDDIPDDFNIARNAVMLTLDRSLKLSDLAFHALAVEKHNPMYIQLAQDINKTIQQATKTLSDLHGSYQKVVGMKKKNESSDTKKDDSNLDGVVTSPFELIKAKDEKGN